MFNFDFTYIVDGIDAHSDDFEDKFFEAGCDDATLVLMNGLVAVCFAREAENYTHAVASAYADLLKTGAKIIRFEPDFLVSKIEIAARANLSRAAIGHYVSGERGEGFPSPCSRITSNSPLWDWVSVSTWLCKKGHVSRSEVVKARVARSVNLFTQQEINHSKGAEKMLIGQFENIVKEPLLAMA